MPAFLGDLCEDVVALASAQERFRMACAYYLSNTEDGLVVGTVNRTDRPLGTTANYGDSGADCQLLGDLYRTEVRSLARGLDLPEATADRIGVAPWVVQRVLRWCHTTRHKRHTPPKPSTYS